VLNGLVSTAATATLVTSPSGDGNQAVQVNVTLSVPLMLSRILGTGDELNVTGTSYAELKSNGSACVIALNGSGTGVTLSGGTALSAPGCAVASNYSVTVPCGTSITTTLVDYNSAAVPSQGCNGIQAPSGKTLKLKKTTTSDPLSGNTAVSAAVSHLNTVALIASPSAPTVSSGGDIAFGYTASSTQSQVSHDGCSAVSSGGIWVVTCGGTGPFNFGNITVAGGITVNFNTSGSSSATYNFSGSINNTGTAMHFGPGTYNIAQGIQTGGGTTTTFGAGTYNIGASSTSNCGAGTYSICNTGTSLTFSGPSTFVVSSGIYNNGGSILSLGSGSTNSYTIGSSASGNSLYVGGGSSTTFADATGAGDVFQMSGMLNVTSGGGSCVTLPAASAHDINGNFSTAGGTILGAGVYTVNGYVALGANGGGDVTCGGSTVGMSGNNVSFVISAASTPASGTCAGKAFCLAAGYSHVTLVAPSSGGLENLIVVGPTSALNTAGATFAEGASNTSLSGVFYIPYGPFTLSGGSSVGSGSGQCLEVIASQVSLSGGTALASTCTGLGGASTGATVLLVQ
jgi:hypothetical protein